MSDSERIELDQEMLNRLFELKEAVEHDHLVWPWSQAHKDALVLAAKLVLAGCRAGLDGDCSWAGCPQLRDGEPKASGRHCPLDRGDVEW